MNLFIQGITMIYNYDRRSTSDAAERTRNAAREPMPKFDKGDRVQVMKGKDVLFVGKVLQVGEYKGGVRSYKIKDQKSGSPRAYDESSLRLIVK